MASDPDHDQNSDHEQPSDYEPTYEEWLKAREPEPEPTISESDLKTFETGRFWDALVVCGTSEWRVHMSILCGRSQWFDKAITGDYVTNTEGPLEPGVPRRVEITEHRDAHLVGLCLRYIYGGVEGVDLAKERGDRPTFMFCEDLFRVANFLLLKPFCDAIQRFLGEYCDEKTRWMWTVGIMSTDESGPQEALVWVEDLKNAILAVQQHKTLSIRYVLMEFMWVNTPLRTGLPRYTSILPWLHENVPGFWEEMRTHCDTSPPFWGPKMRWYSDVLWAPKACSGPVADYPDPNCPRCNAKLETYDGKFVYDGKMAFGQLRDPFNASLGCRWPRQWCKKCVKEVRYPWREDGYL